MKHSHCASGVRLAGGLVAGLMLAASVSAQVVRFETSVGEFDMVLNPTENPDLEGYVDHMLEYVERKSYNGSWINRADTGFVLQMGGFYSHTKRPPLTAQSIRPVASFDPIEGQPAAEIGDLSNTVGTVSLALPGDVMGGTDQDGGTSSFFVNLADNSALDGDFTVFAAISDMSVVDEIMSLMTLDRTTDPLFGAGPVNLAFSDVPLQGNGQQVLIHRAFVINDAMSVARAMAGVEPMMERSLAGGGTAADTAALAALSVPEPTTLLTAVAALAAGLALRPRRRACCTPR